MYQPSFVGENFISLTSLSLLAFVLVLITVYLLHKDKDLPPGPTGIPCLGYWPFLNSITAYLQLENLGKIYGDVFSFRSTGRLIIHLGSIKAMKELQITKSDCFKIRPRNFLILEGMFRKSIAALNGESWKLTRRFYIQSSKECKMISMESYYECIGATFEDLLESHGKPVDMTAIMLDRCSSIMRKTLYGHVGITKRELLDLCDAYANAIGCLSATKMFLFGRIGRIILPFTTGWRESMFHRKRVMDISMKNIAYHESTYDENHVRDFVDMYIKEREMRLRKGDSAAYSLTNDILANSLLQIVGDGIVSVAAYINMFLQGLLDHPEEQDKIYEEIIEVVGTDRQPTIEDKGKLLYTNAFMQEVIRKSDFTPMLPSVECTTETIFRGYRIPVGAITLPNYWAANHDPKVYENPETFNPSRFLDTPKKPREESPMLFGVGKRACIGEVFAMLQAFSFLTTIVQNFRLSKPEGITDENSVVYTPGHTYVIAYSRKTAMKNYK